MSSVAKYVPPHRRREASASTASSTTRPSRASSTCTTTDIASTAPSISEDPDRIVMKIQNIAFDGRTKNPVFLLSNCAPIQGRPTSTLFVFGDSFIGPFKLIKDHIAYKTYPGASAKGLNNPNSNKEVSKELMPILNQLFASRAPEYHNTAVTPVDERYGILMFGNVDLQINYLWQLENKVISDLSFAESERAARVVASGSQATSEGDMATGGQIDNADFAAIPECIVSLSDLAVSDPSSTPLGPTALGPELFVKSVVKHYTEWLEREIVNGPIGKERRRRANEAKSNGITPPTRKLLIAAALPPMVPDDALARITEKYTRKHLPSICQAPTPPMSPEQVALPVKPQSIDELLQRSPTLCDLATRVRMTNDFNTQLREFCARHPDVFVFVDIGPAMKASTPDYPSAFGEVDRSSWADKLDKTNVHPLWEPTISLWQKELAKTAGVPHCLVWTLKEDPTETLKKYEGKKQGVLRRFSSEGNSQDDGTSPETSPPRRKIVAGFWAAHRERVQPSQNATPSGGGETPPDWKWATRSENCNGLPAVPMPPSVPSSPRQARL